MAVLLESVDHFAAGRASYHNGNCVIVATSEAPVSIGSFCAIGRNLTVMPLNHDTNFASVQGTFYRTHFGEPHPGEVRPPSRERSKGGVSIGNDVWIADNVTILSGVTIGDGCCIGAGSIVTRDVPAYAIAAGSPARAIRKRFAEDVVELLEGLRWWAWDEEKIRANKQFFFLDLSTVSASHIRSVVR